MKYDWSENHLRDTVKSCMCWWDWMKALGVPVRGCNYRTLKSKHDEINFYTENPWQTVTDIGKAKTGFVKKIKILGKNFTGREIRSLFKLRSSNFNIDIRKNKVKFIVRGHGHGVGMSQFGAIEMAKNGKNYEEILKHYYTGVEVCDD